jgi:hypothetical protein
MPLEAFANTIQSLERFDFGLELYNIVQANKEKLVDLQQEQLSEGIGKDGRFRSDGYAPLTKFLKKKYGQGLGAVTDRVTFFMTGDLYRSMYPAVTKDDFQVISQLPTFDKMVDRIGEDNYGLDEGQRLIFATEIVEPEIHRVFKEKVII